MKERRQKIDLLFIYYVDSSKASIDGDDDDVSNWYYLIYVLAMMHSSVVWLCWYRTMLASSTMPELSEELQLIIMRNSTVPPKMFYQQSKMKTIQWPLYR